MFRIYFHTRNEARDFSRGRQSCRTAKTTGWWATTHKWCVEVRCS